MLDRKDIQTMHSCFPQLRYSFNLSSGETLLYAGIYIQMTFHK